MIARSCPSACSAWSFLARPVKSSRTRLPVRSASRTSGVVWSRNMLQRTAQGCRRPGRRRAGRPGWPAAGSTASSGRSGSKRKRVSRCTCGGRRPRRGHGLGDGRRADAGHRVQRLGGGGEQVGDSPEPRPLQLVQPYAGPGDRAQRRDRLAAQSGVHRVGVERRHLPAGVVPQPLRHREQPDRAFGQTSDAADDLAGSRPDERGGVTSLVKQTRLHRHQDATSASDRPGGLPHHQLHRQVLTGRAGSAPRSPARRPGRGRPACLGRTRAG